MERATAAWNNLTVGWNGAPVVSGASDSIDLEEWNFRIPIVGQSGSGKSTLLYAISGMMPIMSGGISWKFADGESATWGTSFDTETGIPRNRARQRRFSIAFQDSALLTHLTIKENFVYPINIAREKAGLDISSVDCHIEETLSLVLNPNENVRKILESHPSDISGGQRRRVAIAQAMVTNPDILFLDEPAGGLDPRTKVTVMSKLNYWLDGDKKNGVGRTVFWVTHHLDEAEFENCKYVLALVPDDNNATCIRIMTPAELIVS